MARSLKQKIAWMRFVLPPNIQVQWYSEKILIKTGLFGVLSGCNFLR